MANLINTIRSMYEAKDYNKDGKIDDHEKDHAAEVSKFKDLEKRLKKIEKEEEDEEKEEKNEAMDPVNKKALKKDFDDRKDKDIDNDGDTDDSDEYLHNRRKAVSKAIKGEGKGEKVEVNPKLDEEAIEEQWSITGKDRNGNSHTIYKTKTGSVHSKTGSGSMTSLANYHKDRRLGTNDAQKDLHSKLSGAKDAKSAAAAANQHTNMRWVHEEVELDEAKITHSDQSGPGKGKRMTDLSKSQHMDAMDHHEREQMVAYKKKQSWNEKHHAMMAKAHRMHAQGVGSSHMYKEDKEVTEGKIYASDYETSSEKSQFGGHRPVVKNKKTGKTMYQGSTSYHKPEHAKGHADAYLQGYAQYGEYGANKQSQSYQKAHQKHVKEGLEIQEGLETRIGGGKVPVGQHTLHYKTDKSHKYISNSIKERDPNAKITGKDGHTIVHATAQAHSSVIAGMRKFRVNGVVHDTQASNMKEETMQEGTMQRYNLIKKAAQKINKADKKAARDAAKGIKKDKDLKKVRNDPADRAAPEINEGNAAMELKKYANSKGGIDKQDFIAISNMLAKNKSAKDLAMVLKAQDTDPRDKALEIINKADKKLGADIAKAMGMRQLRAWKEEEELGESVQSAADEIHGDLFQQSIGSSTDMANYMSTILKKHKLTDKDRAAVVKAVKAKGYEGNLLEVELDEARRDAPKGDKNTSAQNPIVVVYDDLGIKGRAGISGNMNLKTFMSIHGISAKHQGTLAKLVAKMGKGKKFEVPSNMLDDYAKEYKDEGKRVPKVWIELNTMKEEVQLEEDYKQDAKNAPFKADPEKKKKEKNSDGTETKPMSRAKKLAKKGLVSEAEMTPAQKRKKEEIVKSMKDKKDYFERKYGDRAKDVMYATATKMAMKEGFELSEETLDELSYNKLAAYKNHAALDKRYNSHNTKNRNKGIGLATKKQQKSNPDNPRPDRAKVGATDHPGHADTKHNYAKTNKFGRPTGSSEINLPTPNEIDKDLAAKKAQKERGMKSEAYVAPSDGGPDGGGTPPVYTTKKGTNYKNGKAIGPVSDPDGGSATKKEQKESTVTSVGDVKAPVATPKKNGTVNKVANDPGSIKAPVTIKKEGTVTSVGDSQGGKVGLSSTDTDQPFANAKTPEPKEKKPKSNVQKVVDFIGNLRK